MIRQLCFVTTALISTVTLFGTTVAVMTANAAPVQIAALEHRTPA